MIFASYNLGKIKEVESILKTKVMSLNDLKIDIEINENGKTFKENASIKAKTIYNLTKIPTIADDSGLEIIALNGFPGINTHRFFKGSDSDRNQEILRLMKNKKNRTCYFTCCMAYYNGISLITSEYHLKGNIALKENINNGFGFDSIFLYKGKYLSNMNLIEKNKVNPRRFALEKLKQNKKFQKNVDF